MKKVFIVTVLLLFFTNSFSATSDIKVDAKKTEDRTKKKPKPDKYKDSIDTTKYKKVKLIDVVLETVSRSDVLKSAREQVIQYEIRVRNAISQHYPTLDFQYDFGRTQLTPSGDEDKEYKYFNDRNYRFVLRQNLYSGGSIDKNVKSVIKKFEVAQNKYDIQLQKEIKKAIKAYFDVVFAKRTVMVNERNMKKLQKILDIVTLKYDNGAASIGDLTSIKASFANAMTKLVRVKSKFIESLRYYEYIVGEKFKKTMPYEKYFDIEVKDFDKIYKKALENNRDLINYYKTIEAEKYNIKKAQAAFKPTVDFEISYKKVLNQEDMVEHEDRVNGKVKLKYNLYKGGRDENKILEVSSKIRDLNYKLEEEKKKIKWNLSKLYTSVDSVSQALESTKNEIISSRKMVSSYWDEFKLGEQDLPALLQGQRQLNTAEKELVKFEKEYINSLFNILQLTGKLTEFFEIDANSQKYLDFSNSDYIGNLDKNSGVNFKNLEDKEQKQESKKDILDKDDSLEDDNLTNDNLNDTQEIKNIQEPQLRLLGKNVSLDEAMDEYTKKFLNFDENSFMIKIGTFKNIFESFKYIRKLEIEDNSLVFDVVDDFDIKTVIVHNNFKEKQQAQDYLKRMKNVDISKEYEIVSVEDLRKLYYEYISGLKVEKPKPKIEVKVKEIVVNRYLKPVEKKLFKVNEEFKQKFLTANKDKYTINISSFTNLNDVEDIIKQNDIYNKSFFFKYGENGSLYKLVYGVFEEYDEAKNYIQFKGIKGDNIFPIVEDIDSVHTLYNENIDFNKKEEKEVEYEYVKSSKIDKETKEKVKEEKEVKELETKENTKESLEELYPLANKDTISKFLDASPGSYSIHIASLPTMSKGVEYIDKNYLENDTVVVQTTAGQAMIMYGVYESYEKAKEVVENLPDFIKRNQPIIRKVQKTQELFKKNNLNNKIGK
ncbi:MAG: TolC family protein [Campylobacterota bacterium]